MIKDEDLKSSIDYSGGQKEAAHRILVELVNIFKEYEDDIRIVGGWVPDLMFPGEGHIGSVDVDVLINHLTLHDEGYQNMARILRGSGYREHPDKYFSFIKTIEIQGIPYDVDVDILAGMYGDVANVSVIAVVPYLIMKAAALGRGKAKDAYDIYFLLKHYRGGIGELAKEFQPIANRKLVKEMKEKLAGKFASADHAGPKDVADFPKLRQRKETGVIFTTPVVPEISYIFCELPPKKREFFDIFCFFGDFTDIIDKNPLFFQHHMIRGCQNV